MSQTYQARRRAQTAPAEAFAHSRVPQYGRRSGGDLTGRTDVTPLSASAVPASASGPMQAKKQSTLDAEDEAARENKELPSYWHPIQRSRAKEEYLSKRSARLEEENLQANLPRLVSLAGSALEQGNAPIVEAGEAYKGAVTQYTAGQEDKAYTPRYGNVGMRYLQTSMLGRSEEERQAMLRGFSGQGRNEDIIPFLVQDIRRLNKIDAKELVSADDETVLNGYAKYAQPSSLSSCIADLIKHRDFDPKKLVGRGKLSKKEMDRFMHSKLDEDLIAAATMLQGLQMMGGSVQTDRDEGKELYAGTKKAQKRRREGK